MRIERLTEGEYERLNAAVESSLPRVSVGEVALAIVDERCDALAAKVADAAERIALAIEAECSGCEMAMECEYQIAARIARTALTGDAS